MKKMSLVLLFALTAFCAHSQSGLYQKVRMAIESRYPQVQTENRLLAVSFWSVSDLASRDNNKAFNKNFNTYKFARLKGGSHGMIAVAVCVDGGSAANTIVLNKDGAGDMLAIGMDDLQLEEKPRNNVVFDSQGAVIYEDLQAGEVFTKINQLLTR